MTSTVCPRLHHAIEVIGARWNGAIVLALYGGARRFGEIRRSVPGVSDTMLAERLKALCHEQIVTRAERGGPVYELTSKGLELGPVVDALTAWSHRWYAVPGTCAEPTADDVVGIPLPTR